MARITHFVEHPLGRVSLHDEVDAKYHINDFDGRRILQFWTTGRKSRKKKGATSQSIQLTEDTGAQLFAILKRAFDLK